MSDCPHDQGQHYIGDAGDLCEYRLMSATAVAALVNATVHTTLDLVGMGNPLFTQQRAVTPDDVGPFFGSIR